MKHNERLRRIISFPDKYAAFRHIVSAFMFLPGLRGLWTANHVDENDNWEDWTKYDLQLTDASTPELNYDGLIPYLTFDGANDYYTRADDALTSITGSESHIASAIRGITLGAWAYTTSDSTHQYLLSKISAAAGNYSYYLAFRGDVAGDPLRFTISDDGTALDTADSSNAVTTSAWHFGVGRFNDNDSGEEQAVFLDGVKTTDTTAMAAIFDGNAAFEIGSGAAGGAGLLTGRVSLAFLCACALPDDMIGALFQQSRALYGI
jgi:hypothetical protein